jgi:hypothetical protein
MALAKLSGISSDKVKDWKRNTKESFPYLASQ